MDQDREQTSAAPLLPTEPGRLKGRLGRLNFNISFGKAPPGGRLDDAAIAEHIDDEIAAGRLPEGTRMARPDEVPGGVPEASTFSLSLSPDSQATDAPSRYDRDVPGLPSRETIDTIRQTLSIITWVLAIGLVVGTFVLARVTGASTEEQFYYTFFAAIVAMMFKSSVR